MNVVIELRGGVLVEAYSSDTTMKIVVVDWDAEASDVKHPNFHKLNDDLFVYAVAFSPEPWKR